MYSTKNGVLYYNDNKFAIEICDIKASSESSRETLKKINKLIRSFHKMLERMVSNEDMFEILKKEKEAFEAIGMPSLSKTLLAWDYQNNNKNFMYPETESMDLNFDITNAIVKQNFNEGHDDSFFKKNKRHFKNEDFDWQKAMEKSMGETEQIVALSLVKQVKELEKFYGRKFKF